MRPEAIVKATSATSNAIGMLYDLKAISMNAVRQHHPGNTLRILTPSLNL